MDLDERVGVLTAGGVGDRDRGVSGGLPAVGLPGGRRFNEGPVGIRNVRVPGQGVTRIMRVMQTNACSLSCGYCPTYCGGKVKRVALAPEEVARVFIAAHRSGEAQGLFLTSGVPGRPTRAMDRMLDAVHVLRRKEGFQGYVHIKVLPGADADQVREAARLATRVSINLEGPRDDVVRRLAPEKDLSGDLLPKLELAGRLSLDGRREGRPDRPAPAGTTTQFVIGATGESDAEILGVVAGLERRGLLHHAHFSAFQPVLGTPMVGTPPASTVREARLYQAEHLLRGYGFGFDELPFDGLGHLPLEHDPKVAWASRHPERFPLEVQRASYEELVRVPGVGPAAARRLLQERRSTVLRDRGDLRRLGVLVDRAAPFLTLRGRRLAVAPRAEQLRLFAPGDHLPAVVWNTPVPPCAYR